MNTILSNIMLPSGMNLYTYNQQIRKPQLEYYLNNTYLCNIIYNITTKKTPFFDE
jgi:hypothetical protein